MTSCKTIRLRLLTVAFLLLCSIGVSAQILKHPPIEFNGENWISKIQILQPEFSIRIDDKDTMSFTVHNTTAVVAKIVKGKIVPIQPYSVSYDTCRQTLTVKDSRLKKSFTFRYYKEPKYLTGLKIQ